MRSFELVHKLNELNHPVLERRPDLFWQECRHLPVHNCLKVLLFGIDNLCGGFASIVVLIVPDKIIPVFLDLQIDEVEEWLALDRLDDILAVGVCIANLGLRGLKNKAVSVGKNDLRTNSTEISHELLEGFARHHLHIIVQGSVIHERVGVLNPSDKMLHQDISHGASLASFCPPSLDHLAKHKDTSIREGILRSKCLGIISGRVERDRVGTLQLVDERRGQDSVDGQVSDIKIDTN